MTIFTTDLNAFTEINEAYGEFFPESRTRAYQPERASRTRPTAAS
jgi:hypothetical protein